MYLKSLYFIFTFSIAISVQARILDPICTEKKPIQLQQQDRSQEKCVEKVINAELAKHQKDIGALLTAKNVSYAWMSPYNYNPLTAGHIYTFVANGYAGYNVEYPGAIVVHIESDEHPKSHKLVYSCGTIESHVNETAVIFRLSDLAGGKIFSKAGTYRCY